MLLDIGLPDIADYEVARQLRANPSTRFGPLIALTGYCQLRDQKAAHLAGFDLHRAKPVEPERVLKAVEQVLARVGSSGRLKRIANRNERNICSATHRWGIGLQKNAFFSPLRAFEAGTSSRQYGTSLISEGQF